MAAGDLITGDWQVEIRSLLLGDGTDYDLVDIQGIEGQTVKTADLSLLGDGSTLGVDRRGPRRIILTIEAAGAPGTAMAELVNDFTTAWDIGGDVELHWQVDGEHKMVTGRTREWGPIPNQQARAFGLARWDAEFFCGDPTITVV